MEKRIIMEKQTKTDNVGSISCCDMDGLNLEGLIEFLKNRMPVNAILDYDYAENCYTILQYRIETDEEFQKRVTEENIKTQRLEAQEKAKLAELLEKYGDK